MIKLIAIEQYHDIVKTYGQQGCRTNDYLQSRVAGLIEGGALFADCHEHNAYLFERKANCCRMYYYLNDLTEIDAVDAPDPVVAVEILYRGSAQYPEAERDFLKALGFEENVARDQYAAVYKDLRSAASSEGGVTVRLAQDNNEVAWACRMFNATFDPYSGDFIPDGDFQSILDGRQMLIAVDEAGTRLGALHQTNERNVAWISHVAVVAEARGRHVGQALLDAFVEINHGSDKSRYMLWVQQQNQAAVAMYQNKGFKYINKSTLSLTKKTT